MSTERVFRPVRTRAFAVVLSIVVAGAALMGWFLLPEDIRVLFSPFQIATLLVILGFMVTAMMLLAFSSVRVDDAGLVVRNGPFTRRVRWDDVASVRFRHGDPWVYLVLSGNPDDPSRVALLGLQATDGPRTLAAVSDLRAALAARRSS